MAKEWTLNKSKHKTLEKKILPLLLPGIKPTTFRSSVWSSTNWAILTVSGHQPLCLLLSEDEHEIFNVFNDLSVCCAHESETWIETTDKQNSIMSWIQSVSLLNSDKMWDNFFFFSHKKIYFHQWFGNEESLPSECRRYILTYLPCIFFNILAKSESMKAENKTLVGLCVLRKQVENSLELFFFVF